jgi:hypothetical protein
MTLSIHLYDNEIWNLRKKNKKQLTSIEIKFFRRRVGDTLFDHKRNKEILEGLKLEPFDEIPRRYKSNCLRHVTRMNKRIPKIMLNYRKVDKDDSKDL